MAAPRKYLGRDQNLGAAIRVYLLPDAIEIDELTFVEIERTRVYFDDILAITYHRSVSVLFLVLTGLVGGIPLMTGLYLLTQGQTSGAAALLVMAAPWLLFFLVHLFLRTDVITVFGRRTMARMRFQVRKGRARAVYAELTEKVRIAQEAIRAAQPPPPAPAAPELPLPPPTPPEPGPASPVA
jgi:hypothetical protein